MWSNMQNHAVIMILSSSLLWTEELMFVVHAGPAKSLLDMLYSMYVVCLMSVNSEVGGASTRHDALRIKLKSPC